MVIPSYDGRNCDDINECDLGTHNCDVNAVCENTEGNYTCVDDGSLGSRKRRSGSRVRAAEGFVEQVDVDYYTGTATFDNLEFFGDLAATKLEFTVLIPPDWETAEEFTLETDEIIFAPQITLETQWEIDECIEAGNGYAFR